MGAKSIVMVHVIFITSEGVVIIVFFVIFKGDAEFFHVFLVLLDGLIREVVGEHGSALKYKSSTDSKQGSAAKSRSGHGSKISEFFANGIEGGFIFAFFIKFRLEMPLELTFLISGGAT